MARPVEVAHDESPSGVTDHAFEPKGEWWTLCKHCNKAESAHAESAIVFRYFGDDEDEDDD